MREWFAYQLQDRPTQENLFVRGGRLFQQFLVDGYTMVETERLYFHRSKQSKLRCDTYSNIRNSVASGNSDPTNLGKPVILPSTFTGGIRYMKQNYMDAMALCRWYGCPDLFITMTCNPNWPEIGKYTRQQNLSSSDRPDMLTRVFKMKLNQLMNDVKHLHLFGRVQAVVYTVEFQKRGLPHAHICLFLHKDDKVPNVEQIDQYISAEIPDPNEDPDLYKLVSDFMMHGPCGEDDPNQACMVDRKCTKHFPKPFTQHSSVDSEGYPVYRRRDNRNHVDKTGHKLHNGYVIPYNVMLLKRPDRVSAELYETVTTADGQQIEKPVDEIKAFYDCRYLSACEASWRIFGYEIHYRTPSVERLSFHLEGEQQIVYDENSDLETVVNKPTVGASMFIEWMEMNKLYPAARELTYAEFPTKFVWNDAKRKWTFRKQRYSIGRIHNVPIGTGDAFYCRMLLNSAKGCFTHDDIKKVNNIQYPTYKEACYAAGLLEDDREYVESIRNASHWASAEHLRDLFVTLLAQKELSTPLTVWFETWHLLAQDVEYKKRQILQIPDLRLSDDEKKNVALFYIEELMRARGTSLRRFPEMPYPDSRYISEFGNRLIYDELDYNPSELQAEYVRLHNTLTTEQRGVYDTIMNSVETKTGGVYFVYGYGGTGKTFLWKTLAAAIRRKGDIVLNVASSGIASLLMSGGRTAHSRFHIPINIDDTSTCSICPQSDLAALLKKCKLIIWDEAPMTNKLCFEALDRSLRDILRTSRHDMCETPFGNMTVVFGGNFRQVLPVIPKGSRQDIVGASLKQSYLWDHCKVLKLTANMRLTVGSRPEDVNEIREFVEWILKVDDRVLGEANDGEVEIDIPEEIQINEADDPVASIIDFTYPNILSHINDPTYFQEKAILAPTNE
ncbi:uncharacterized protein Tco_0154509, partial [Tanacetum coccineum]